MIAFGASDVRLGQSGPPTDVGGSAELFELSTDLLATFDRAGRFAAGAFFVPALVFFLVAMGVPPVFRD